MLFFGVYRLGEENGAGHYWYGPDRTDPQRRESEFLSDCGLPHIDVKFPPMVDAFVSYASSYAAKTVEETQPQSAVAMHFLKGKHIGWTVGAFWDRTGDSRAGSHGAFVSMGFLPYADLIGHATKEHPRLVERIQARPPDLQFVESRQGGGKPFRLWGEDIKLEAP